MIKSCYRLKNDLQTMYNYPLANQNFNNENQRDSAADSLSKEIQFSENLYELIPAADNKCGLLCPSSPSSDISFGWQEVTNTCPDQITTIEYSDSDVPIDGKGGRNFSDLGVTTTNKEESNLSEASERLAYSKHLTVKPAVSEKLVKDLYRPKRTRDLSESEDCESVSTCHSGEELAQSQKLAVMSDLSVKLAEDSWRMKKTHGVPMGEDSENGSADCSKEMSFLLNSEEYGRVKMECALEVENLTEEEEIWMLQCPISFNPKYLENKKLVFGGTSDFTLQVEGVQRFETTSYVHRNKPVSCLLPSRKKGSVKAKVLHPEGLIVITEKGEVPELEITLPKQTNIQTPKGLRVRHPLFGKDYEQELELRKGLTSQDCRMVHEDLLICSDTTKKRKKDKNAISNGISEGTGTCNERGNWEAHEKWEQVGHRKKEKKRKKRNLDKDTSEESEILFNTKRRKKDSHEQM